MSLTRRSKIKDLWLHPLGHDILLHLLRKNGWKVRWAESPVVANLPLTVLDRYAWPGFTDMALEMCAAATSPAAQPELEEKTWWKEAVIYQIFLPSFMDSDHDGVGDLDGVRQRLPYLSRLGVDVIWLRPLLRKGVDGNVLDYRRTGEEAGSDEAFGNLAVAAHGRGIRILISLDIAGVSQQHPWFQDALQNGEHRGFFFFKPGRVDAPPNNWERAPGVKAWNYYPGLGMWGLCSGGGQRMDLNWDNPKLREEMAEILRYWRNRGADGFCFGAANQISKSSFEDGDVMARGLLGRTGFEHYSFGPRLGRYLKELRDSALTEDVLTLGGVSGFGTEMAKLLIGEGRAGLNMVLDSSHLSPPLRSHGEEDRLCLQDLRRYYLYWMEHYGNEKWMSLFLESADTPRMVGRLGANPLYRSILSKMLGTWLLTMRGTPVLYQGEELGLSGTRFSSVGELHDLEASCQAAELCERHGFSEQAALQKVQATSAGQAHTPMPWSAGPGAGFTGAVPWMRLPDGAEHLNVANQTADPCSVWHHYQQLITLRKQNPCLVYGSFKPVFIKNNKILCYFRIFGNQKWYVELNLSEKQMPRPGRIQRTQRLLLSNYEAPARGLRPYEANLYLCETN